MKRVILIMMCLLASFKFSSAVAQKNEPKFGISPMAVVDVNKMSPLQISVIYRNVKDIKLNGVTVTEKIDLEEYSLVDKMNDVLKSIAVGDDNVKFVRKKTLRQHKFRDNKVEEYYLIPNKFGTTKVEFTAVADNGEVLKKTLVMNVCDGRNEGLEIDIPSDKIVKKGKTYPFIVNVGEDVKYVNVYIYGQDNVYYKKVSKGKVSFDLDLSGVSGEVRVKITAYDEEYKNRSIDTKLEVKH